MADGLDIRFEEAAEGGRYFIVMPNGGLSRLHYTRAGDRHIIADSTFVPPPYRGNGVAEAMVQRLIDDARAAGLRITPTCWFVADEFARHRPDGDDVLAR